jgi:hypothetical protein
MSDEVDAMEEARSRIVEIQEKLILRSAEFNEQELQDVHRQVLGKNPKGSMHPDTYVAWDQLFGFGTNGRKWLRGDEDSSKRQFRKNKIDNIRASLECLGALYGDVPTYGASPPSWMEFLDCVNTFVASNPRLRPPTSDADKYELTGIAARLSDRDLHYIGDDANGIAWLEQNCTGVEHVYNTVFTRSQKSREYTEKELLRLYDVMKKLLTGDCLWSDIVLPKEKKGIAKLYRDLTAEQKRGYRAHLLETTFPLIQCLVVKYKDKSRFAVLAGWSFPGSQIARVYLSYDRDACDYFENYWHQLFEKRKAELFTPERDKIPQKRNRKPQQPSSKKRASNRA